MSLLLLPAGCCCFFLFPNSSFPPDSAGDALECIGKPGGACPFPAPVTGPVAPGEVRPEWGGAGAGEAGWTWQERLIRPGLRQLEPRGLS